MIPRPARLKLKAVSVNSVHFCYILHWSSLVFLCSVGKAERGQAGMARQALCDRLQVRNSF